jgi:hypothetical protein
MPSTPLRAAALLLVLALVLPASPLALAGTSLGPDIHAGVVKSVGKTSFVLVDAETGESLTFDATPVQLLALTPGMAIKVKYITEDGALKAIRIGR